MGFILIIFIYGLIITFPVCLMAGLLTLRIHISNATILSSWVVIATWIAPEFTFQGVWAGYTKRNQGIFQKTCLIKGN